MKRNLASLSSTLILIFASAAIGGPAASPWHITGELTEACTCHVPCTCEFGQGPSPDSRCHAVVSMAIEKGNRGAIGLDGLKLGFAWAEKGVAIYIDASATRSRTGRCERWPGRSRPVPE